MRSNESTYRRKSVLGLAGLVVLAVAGLLFSWPGASAPASPRSQPNTHAEDTCESAPGPRGEEKDAAEERSDLDRSLEELWSMRCEHDIVHYTCDECRYELGVVKLPPDLLSQKGAPGLITTAVVETVSYSESLLLTGEVKLSEGKTAYVSTPVPGVVRKVFVEVGRVVQRGDALIEVDSHEVAETKGEYMKKEAALDLARKTAAREATLFDKKISAETEVQHAHASLREAEVECANARTRLVRLGLSEEEISSLEHKTLGNRAGVLTIRAPQSGFIVARAVNVGENLEPAKEAFVLSDLSEVWVWADLRENDIPRIAESTNGSGSIAAEVRALGSETTVYRGTLDVLAGAMDEQTRTLKARVVIPNPDGLLRPGMFVNIRLSVPGERSGLGVPSMSVLTDEGRQFVFVHKEGDYWIRRPVVVGKVFGNGAEIKEGLVPGQKIIADGSFLLKSDVLRQKMGAGCAD